MDLQRASHPEDEFLFSVFPMSEVLWAAELVGTSQPAQPDSRRIFSAYYEGCIFNFWENGHAT